jgi:hypothetical protein
MLVRTLTAIVGIMLLQGCEMITAPARQALFCQSLSDDDKHDIAFRLALANGCHSPKQSKLTSISDDGEETYEVYCDQGNMEFHCQYYMNKACFVGEYDLPINQIGGKGFNIWVESACWRTR